jgi:Tfp pilus assembly protein PilV
MKTTKRAVLWSIKPAVFALRSNAVKQNDSRLGLYRNNDGFGIVEVLIAIFLLAVAMLGLVTLQSRGIRGNDLGNRTSQAIALAQDKVEDLINDNATGQTLAAGTDTDIDETGSAGGIFDRNWQIQNDTPVTNSQTLVVTVTWNDIGGNHTVTMNGIVSSDGY